VKICILQVIHPPFDKRVFQKIAKSLVAAGHEVVSIAPTSESIPPIVDGVKFIAIPEAKSLTKRAILALRLVGAGRKIDADAYLAVEPESWVSALLVKFLTGRPVVFDVHEYIPTEFAKFFPSFLHGLIAWLTIRSMRLMARMTDHIILTKASLDREFEGLRVPRTVVLNTNHLQPRCPEVPEAIRKEYSPHDTAIHQGIFGDVRGSYQLLDAMKIVSKQRPDAKCILLGDYVYGDENEYRSAINDSGLANVLRMLGSVSFEKVPQYIAASGVGLILFQPYGMAHTLGMPHKLFDYMRESVPVVAPDFAVEIRRIIEDADCGVLVDVTQPESIAEAILKLLNDRNEAERLGRNGRHAVETKYNWQNDERNLISVFAGLQKP
jgi:glycosyltransferase involved in cell wall biosynthesis